MATQTTQYDVIVNYKINDSATQTLKDIARHSENTAGMLRQLRNGLLLLRVGGPIWNTMKEGLIGYNAHIEEAKLRLTALSHMNLGGPWERAREKAAVLFSELRQQAIETPATAKELVDFATLTENAYLRAGGSMEKFAKFTTGAVVASKMLGMEGIAAIDIQQALGGQLTIRDRFMRAMLEPMGMSHKDFNKIAKQDPSKALDILDKLFNQKSIKNAIKDYQNTFVGASSIMKEQFEMILGNLGLPLFKAITKEITSWNKWLQDNPEKIAEIADSLGRGLVEGFHMVKDAVTFIVENKDTLMALGAAFLALKGAQGLAGAAAAPASGLAGQLGRLGGAAQVAALALIGLEIGLKHMNRNTEDDIQKESNRVRSAQYMYAQGIWEQAHGSTDGFRGSSSMNMLTNVATDVGALKFRNLFDDKKGFFSKQKYLEEHGVTPESEFMLKTAESGVQGGQAKENAIRTRREFDNMYIAADRLQKAFNGMALSTNFFGDVLKKAEEMFGVGNRKPFHQKDVHVHVDKIEVASQDPDRFVHGMMNAFADIAENPTQARDVLRELGQ